MQVNSFEAESFKVFAKMKGQKYDCLEIFVSRTPLKIRNHYNFQSIKRTCLKTISQNLQ